METLRISRPFLRTEPAGCRRHVAYWSRVHPEFAKCLLAYVALRPTVTICRCYLTVWDIVICDVTVLRLESRGHFAYLFANITSPQSHIAGLFTNESTVFAKSSPLFSLTSPRYSPQSPSFRPTSLRHSPTSLSFMIYPGITEM